VIASCSYGNTTGVDSVNFLLSRDPQTASEAHSTFFLTYSSHCLLENNEPTLQVADR
jgi:hypothetical protein